MSSILYETKFYLSPEQVILIHDVDERKLYNLYKSLE